MHDFAFLYKMQDLWAEKLTYHKVILDFAAHQKTTDMFKEKQKC
jgi:hypothetical protein